MGGLTLLHRIMYVHAALIGSRSLSTTNEPDIFGHIEQPFPICLSYLDSAGGTVASLTSDGRVVCLFLWFVQK